MTIRSVVFAAVLLSAAFSTAIAAAAPVEKPNIIFIMVDDLGKEWVGCYGADNIKTYGQFYRPAP